MLCRLRGPWVWRPVDPGSPPQGPPTRMCGKGEGVGEGAGGWPCPTWVEPAAFAFVTASRFQAAARLAPAAHECVVREGRVACRFSRDGISVRLPHRGPCLAAPTLRSVVSPPLRSEKQ